MNGRKEHEIVIIGPGEIFGELEVEKNCPRITSCRTTCHSSVLYIPKTEFYRRINNKISWNYLRKLVELRDLLITNRIQQIS